MGSPLTILHVVVNMNRGGAETFIMNLYRNIDRTKVQFHFLTFKPGVFDQEIKELGGKVHRLPYITELGHYRFIKQLNHFMKEHHHYKIVHSHLDKMSGLILRSAKEAKIPIRIAHSHNTKSEGGTLSKLYKSYASTYILSSATHLYACSKVAANWLFKDQSSKAKIINNGIDMKKFSFCEDLRAIKRLKLSLEKDIIVLGHVGRFNQQKNHTFLLDIISLLKEKIPNIVLVFVGDGPLQKTIIKKTKTLQIENNVRFLGMRSDIDELLQVFDLFLMPSHHEGLPLTLVEAQSASLPCIISENITKEVDLGGKLIRYLPIKDAHKWVDEIVSVIDDDRFLRHRFKRHFLNDTYNIKKTAKHTATTYLDLGNEAI